MVRKGIADNLSFLSFDPEAVLSKATYVSTDETERGHWMCI